MKKSDPDPPPAGHSAFDPAEIVANLPHLPGVYRMLNGAGDVLYVGKARDLKKRVASYFQKTASLAPRIQLMVGQVQGLETTVARSEAEALLLENNFIKSLSPRYNILYRDDKSYPHLVLTGERFPRLGFHRGGLDKANHYFGPFSNAGAVRESIRLMQKIFRLRTCEETVFSNRSRPCLLYQIKRCTGPCVGLIDESTYAEDVRSAELFLQGREDEAVSRLEERMHRAAEQQAYEQAAAYRDQIRSLSKVRETQFVSSSRGVDADIVALASSGGLICVNLVVVRGGQHRGDKSFFPQNARDQDEQSALEAFLGQHYVDRDVPPSIILNRPVESAALEELLSQQAGIKVQFNINPAGERRVWLRMAEKNAELAIAQRLAAHATQEARLTALQQALNLGDNIQRIECFDVSHTMGEATVASCVVYDHASMQPGEYRTYNIAGIEPGDDYAAMRQVLDRRYRKIVEGEGRLPDLILIDGGKGQVGAAYQVLGELGLSDLPMIGVAKGEERKAGLEQMIFPERAEPLRLPADNPGLHLIQQIRDEAHRFAISGHRNRRAKTRNRSTLEEIAGVGSKRRQRLLSRFGGLKGVASASIEELKQVEGISRELAEKIYQQLH
ncbi:MAG: excinuclease ABC subunit UvrC [Betaproteobacteria bacterium]|nr:excinuclease ABC subunit UvrC [Betaproteobacteria bacterium]